MEVFARPQCAQVVRWCITTVAAAGFLGGCQSYQKESLDISAHRTLVGGRALDLEPLTEFLDRLRDDGAATPDRFDLSDGLSAAEGEVVALFYNPELRLARMNAGVALATLETAGLWKDPRLGFNGAELVAPTGPFESALLLNFTLPVSGRLAIEKDRAGAAYEAELRRIVSAEWALRIAIRRGWAEWTVAEERGRLLREVVAQVERITLITDRLEETGDLGRIEGRLFRIELVQRRAALISTDLAIRQARLALLRRMGFAPDAAVEFVAEFDSPELLLDDDPVARLIRANTEIAFRRAAHRTADETLRLEVRKQFPDIKLGAGYGSEDSDNRLVLGATLPIPVLNANRPKIAKARANRKVARVAMEISYERLAHELAASLARYEAATAQGAAFEAEVVPMLAEQTADAQRIAELGSVNTLLLLDTVQRQFQAKTRLLNLRLAEIDAALRITELLGPETEQMPSPIEKDEADHSTMTAAEPAREEGAQ